MNKCTVCGSDAEKCILFKPSDVFVFLCYNHIAKVFNKPANIKIADWIEKEKNDIAFIKSVSKGNF